MSWLLAFLGFAAILAWGGWWYFQSRIDGELRAAVESRLAKEFPHLKVTIGHARLIDGKGLEFRDVCFSEARASGPHPELVQIEELFVECEPDLTKLAQGELGPKQITARHVTVTATQRPQNTWSLASLARQGDSSSCCRIPFPILIEDGTLLIFDPFKDPSGAYALRDIRAELVPAEAAISDQGLVKDYTVRATSSGDFLRRVQLEGTLRSGAVTTWDLQGRAEGLQLSSDISAALPSSVADFLKQLGELRGEIAADFQSRGATDKAPQFALQATLQQGSWRGPQWPEGITGISAKFAADATGLRIDELTAASGATNLWLRGTKSGWSENSPANWEMHLRGVRVDRTLRDKLPAAYSFLWNDYAPDGTVDITARLKQGPDAPAPDLVVDCTDLSFAYRNFPYRIGRVRGRITYQANAVSARLQGFAGTYPVRIEAEINQPGDNWKGWLDIRTDSPMPIDARMIAALPESTQQVVQSLQPRGLMQLAGRFSRSAAQQPLAMQLGIDITQGEMVYQHFRYPLSNITGRAECVDGTWRFLNFAGVSGSSQVTASGQWRSSPTGGDLALSFQGRQVELNAALRDALPENARQAWQSLRPQGSLDEVNVGVAYRTGDLQPEVAVRVRQFPPSQTGRQLVIDPVACSYRFDQVHGEAELQKGALIFRGLRATHGRTTFAADAAASTMPDGRVRLDVQPLSIDRLTIDEQLTAALPDRWRGTVSQLGVSGALNLRGNLQLVSDLANDASRPAAPTAANWDFSIDVDDGGLNIGVPLEHIHGGMRLTGSGQGDGWSSRGELAIDSLFCKGLQVTQVQGPIWLDPTSIALGAWAHRGDPRKLPRQIVARTLGGTIYGDAQATPTADGPFALQAALADASLTQAALELAPAHRELKGRLFAAVELSGAGRRVDLLRGKGNIRLRDADLYELPVFFSLLKVARARQPDRTAFTNADGEFEIAQGRAVFRQLSFAGDAITLKGQGEIGFDRHVNLTMHSLVGGDSVKIPILNPVLGEASRQIMEIHVTGTLDAPQLDSKAFPALKETLDRLFPDLQRADRSETWPARTREADRGQWFRR